MDPAWKKYFDPPTLAELAGLGLRRSQLFDGGPLAGAHRSSRHGHSVEFAEHRPYVPGDDLRSVDWKIYGRTDRYFLRNREDETTLVCHLLLDATGSMTFAGLDAALAGKSSDGENKFDYAARVAASIGFITIDAQDQCSLSILGGQGWDLPVGSGEPQLQALAESLSRSAPEGELRIGGLIRQTLPQLERRGVVVVVSDLLDDVDELDLAVRQVHAAGHDLLLVQVLHPQERKLPVRGVTRFEGMEGEPPIEVQAEAYADAYQQALQQFDESVQQLCRDSGTHLLSMTSDQPLGKTLAAGLHQFYG
ncbi:DUF58 domain-containing protein [Roseimaritima ulvae]|uniref:DUF58 domain-containing protein n=1 Tax=Roseimaritima ulvae TaxID=980254 RepID=A0A5B9R914_9BACT|nr:DUF58 domain-containing protein [Roseimaritima ulvae]QEG43223.1 hypothetical protein UC8_52690 [Roseimaritima ulvae]